MKVLFHLGHPAHFHLFKHIIANLKNHKHEVFILIKKKDVLKELLDHSGLDYHNILPKGRKDGKLGIAIGQLKQNLKLLWFCLKRRPDLMLGTSVSIAHVGKVLRIPSVNVQEDDHDIVPLHAKLAYPWSDHIIAPNVCTTGKWDHKTIRYNGYHEHAYLRPEYFKPDRQIVDRYIQSGKKYIILRLAKLSAHHDTGIDGINDKLVKRIIQVVGNFAQVYISNERPLKPELEPYRLNIKAIDIHHILACADLYIGDSQTMAAEAALVGTPSIRFNDFVGKIGYLEELEHKYGLTIGIKTHEEQRLIETVEAMIQNQSLISEWTKKKNDMLAETIDVTAFLTWFICEYPQSVEIIQNESEWQKAFLIAEGHRD